ncbi:hypothetical protein THRCLA_11661 [Thraustotheca clavata]|uniref:EF-hand domain-containing protein n=1 Tax=Thraustotheca clavata TaxID=74557 RepID=A0A1V9Y710_9STRA|nr:hypothetical protein THRCLA_11661 [Thraustotheca clavata]
MKKGLVKAHSEALLPPSNDVFTAGTPLHATLAQLEHKNNRNVPAKPFLAEKAQTPENTKLFAYTNALLHRVTGRYLPACVVGNNPSQAEEVKHLQSDPELLIVIQSIQELSGQFHEVAQAVLAHRKELGKLLLKLKISYVGLFERVLESSMRFYYNYRQENAKERHDLKQHAIAQATTIQEHEETIRVLSHHLEAKESVMKSYKVQVQELEFQNLTLKELENEWLTMQDEYRVLKRYKFESTKREEALVVREEAIQEKEDTVTRHAHYLDVQSKTEHGRIIEEARQTLHQNFNIYLKKYKEAYHKVVEEAKHLEEHTRESPTYFTTKPNATASTQTLANEDGLWDIQDGVPKSVSKHVQSSMMWRRFTAFVKCKNCHGKPFPANGFNCVDQAYNEVWMVKHKKKRWTKTTAKEWRIPSFIMTFLANLPKTVQAITYYNHAELVSRIEMLYDAKYIADCADAADGVAYQSMDHFVAEYYLKQCLGRQQAEVELYKLLISVKALYLGSPYLHLFARFLHLLDSAESSDNVYHYDPDIDEKAQTTKLELRQLNIAPQQFLSQSFLRVFLHARHQALNHPDLGSAHIISVDNATKWINLDYAIKLLKWYLSYLPENKLHTYCRQLEHNTGLYIGGTITATKGNHLAVRAQMRATMLIAQAQTELRRKEVVLVNVYVLLELIIEVLLMRTKTIENELHELFLTGDINHDKVLSFAEFCTILKPRAPGFNERRLLRMFREALTLGSTQSYAISSEAFIQVCTDHGLVALVPKKTLEAALT